MSPPEPDEESAVESDERRREQRERFKGEVAKKGRVPRRRGRISRGLTAAHR